MIGGQTPRAPSDRAARLDDWQAFAADARAHAEDAVLEPTDAFRRRAEMAGLWAWPEAGQLRCKALTEVARLFAQARPSERAALAGALGELAGEVLAAVREAHSRLDFAGDGPGAERLRAYRAPYRDD